MSNFNRPDRREPFRRAGPGPTHPYSPCPGSYRPSDSELHNYNRGAGARRPSDSTYVSCLPRQNSMSGRRPSPPPLPMPPPPPDYGDMNVMNPMSPSKRRASRSPEGNAAPRKASRSAGASVREGSMTPNGLNGQRQPAVSERPSRGIESNQQRPAVTWNGRSHIGEGNSPAIAHAPHLMTDLSSVQSPSSPGSRASLYEDATSQRSTPQPPHPYPGSNMELSVSGRLNEELEQGGLSAEARIQEIFANISKQLAVTASLMISREKYNDRLKAARKKLEEVEHMSTSFPAVIESYNEAKRQAKRDVGEIDKQLNKHKASQQALARSIADTILTILARRPEVQPIAAPSMDHMDEKFVTLADYNKLQKDHEDFKADITQQISALREEPRKEKEATKEDVSFNAANFKNLQGRVVQLEKSSDVADLQVHLEAKMRETKETTQRMMKSTCHVEQLAKVEKRVDKLESSSRDTQRSLERVGQLKNQQDGLTKKVNSLEADRVAKKFSSPPGAPKLNEEISTSVTKLNEEVKRIKEDLDVLQTSVIGSEDEEFDDEADLTSSFRKRLYWAELKHKSLEGDVHLIQEETHEEGKKSLVERFKKHDQLINNLWSDIKAEGKASIHQRLAKVELGHDSLDSKLKELQQSPGLSAANQTSSSAAPPVETSATAGEMEIIRQRLSGLDDLLSQQRIEIEDLKEDAVSLENMVTQHVAGKANETFAAIGSLEERISAKDQQVGTEINSVRDRLATLRNDFAQSKSVTSKGLTQLEDRLKVETGELSDRFGNTFSTKAELEELKIKTTVMSDSISFLEQQISTKSRAPTPQVGMQQFKPLTRDSPAVQSPQMNSTDSPRLNGGGGQMSANSPTVNYHSGPNGVPSRNIEQELTNLGVQHDATIGFVNHLKQRFDNLTTDELVKAMSAQISEMYPAARDFQNAINYLTNWDQTLDAKVEGISATLRNVQDGFDQLQNRFPGIACDVNTARTQAQGAKSVADTTRTMLENLRQRVQGLNNRVDGASGPGDTADTTAMQSIRNGLTELQTQQRKLTDRVTGLGAAPVDSASAPNTTFAQGLKDDLHQVQIQQKELSVRVRDLGTAEASANKALKQLVEDVRDENGSLAGTVADLRKTRESEWKNLTIRLEGHDTKIAEVEERAKHALTKARALEVSDASDYAKETRRKADEALADIVKLTTAREKNETPESAKKIREDVDALLKDVAVLNEAKAGLQKEFDDLDQFKTDSVAFEADQENWNKETTAKLKELGKALNEQGVDTFELEKRVQAVEVCKEQLAGCQAQLSALEDRLKLKGYLGTGRHDAASPAFPARRGGHGGRA